MATAPHAVHFVVYLMRTGCVNFGFGGREAWQEKWREGQCGEGLLVCTGKIGEGRVKIGQLGIRGIAGAAAGRVPSREVKV